VARFDLLTNTVESILATDADSPISAMDIDSTGQFLAVASEAGVIDIWNLSAAQRTLRMNAHSNEIRSVTWSPDGAMLASGGSVDAFKVWNSATGERIAALDVGPGAATTWSPDGSRLATLTWWGDVRVWDVTHWRLIHHLPHEVGNEWSAVGVEGLVWNPTGNRLAARLGGWLVVWDAITGRQLWAIRAHLANTRCLAWSPDGSRLATGSEDHSIKIWNANTGEHLLTLRGGDKQSIFSLSWSPDGAILASVGETLKLWDATSAFKKYP
jgi:WD40 repeat protein